MARELTGPAKATRFFSLWVESGYNLETATEKAKKEGLLPSTARKKTSVLLRDPVVEDLMREHLEDLRQSALISEGRVLAELADIAYSSIDDFVEWKGGDRYELRIEKASPRQRRAIQEFNVETRYERDEKGKPLPVTRIRLKLYPKLTALDRLGDYLRMWAQLKSVGDTSADQLTDEERASRVAAILESARGRRAGQLIDGESTRVEPVSGPGSGDPPPSETGDRE